MEHLRNYIGYIWANIQKHRLLAISFAFFFLFSFSIQLIAAPPSSPYGPGATLDPTCAPGDANCTVSINQVGNSYDGATAGSLLFFDASQELAQNNDALYWDEANEYLGVGTGSPETKLHVAGGGIKNTPGAPTPLGSISDDGVSELNGARGLAIAGKYAYVAGTSDAGMEILDISDPTNPTHVGDIENSGSRELFGAFEVAVSGQYAYVAALWDHGFQVVDISNPADPVATGRLPDNGTTLLESARDVHIVGKYAFVLSESEHGLEVIDISDPTNPAHAGKIVDDGTTLMNTPLWMYIQGKYAYITSWAEGGLQIVDISDPTNPVAVGNVADDGSTYLQGTNDVFVSGRYAYVTSSADDSFSIIDVSDPTSPQVVGQLVDDGTTLLDTARKLWVAGNYAYVTSQGENGVQIIDVSDPTNPTPVANITDTGSTELDGAWDIVVSGKYAYVTGMTDKGFQILDISGIESSTASIGNLSTTDIWTTNNLTVGNRAYINNGLNVGPGGLYVDAGEVAIDGNSSGTILDLQQRKTGLTSTNKVVNITNNSSTFDTTGGDLSSYGLHLVNTASESTGSNVLTNVGLYVSASGGDNNYAAIFEDGNVGIGTTSPNELLTVSGILSLAESSSPSATTGYGKLYPKGDNNLYYTDEAGTEYQLTGSGVTNPTLANIATNSTSTSESLYTMSTGVPVEFETSANSPLLYLDETNGRVGVSNDSPAHALDVSGKVGINGTQTIYLLDQGSFPGSLVVGDGGTNISDLGGGFHGQNNTFVGMGAGEDTTGGAGNTFIGSAAGKLNTTGYSNTAIGRRAFDANISGHDNAAIGIDALGANTSGDYNVAIGHTALWKNTSGNKNVAVGPGALRSNTGGSFNSAIGSDTLRSNTSGNYNSAIGEQALYFNDTGSYNNAFGHKALYASTSSHSNVAMGHAALRNTSTGTWNVGVGRHAGFYIQTGTNNVVIGGDAAGYGGGSGTSYSNNVLIGYKAGFKINADNNVLIGYQAGDNITTGASNIIIGDNVDAPNATGSNQINIGNTIYGDTSSTEVGIGTSSPNEVLTVSGVLSLSESSSPSATTGYGKLYPKTDNNLYYTDEAGTEYQLTGSGVTNPTLADIATNSSTNADQTFALNNGTTFTIETSGGSDLVSIRDDSAFSIGSGTSNSATTNTLIGNSANTGTSHAVALGYNAYGAIRGVGIGSGVSTGTEGVGVGMDTSASAQGVSIGYEVSTPSAPKGVFIGNAINQSRATGGYHVVLGYGSSLTSGSLGFNNSEHILIGRQNTVSASDNFSSGNILLGNYLNANSAGAGSFVIGNGVGSGNRLTNSIANSLIVGFKSTSPSLFLNKSSNLVLATQTDPVANTTFDTSATNTLTIRNGSSPSASVNDSVQMYANDVNGDGTASPHFLTEAGNTVKLYQQDQDLLSLDNTGLTNFSGSVGVGNNNPGAKLHVTGNGTSTGMTFRVSDSADRSLFRLRDDGYFALGWGAVSGKKTHVVVGYNASANESTYGHSVAIGQAASTTKHSTVTIGYRAETTGGPYSLALGFDATANALRAAAFGGASAANHNYSTALGWGTTTTKENQIALGRSADDVYVPGELGVNTTSPSEKLTLQDGNLLLTADTSTLTDGSALNSGDTILRGYYDSDGTAGVTATAKDMKLRNVTSSSGDERLAVVNNAGTEFATFDGANGRVGVGVTSPNEALSVSGVLSLSESSAPSATTGYGKLYPKTDNNLYYTDEAGAEYQLNNTFSNGLTESGGAVKLGGNLTENTTINRNGFNLEVDTGWSAYNSNYMLIESLAIKRLDLAGSLRFTYYPTGSYPGAHFLSSSGEFYFFGNSHGSNPTDIYVGTPSVSSTTRTLYGANRILSNSNSNFVLDHNGVNGSTDVFDVRYGGSTKLRFGQNSGGSDFIGFANISSIGIGTLADSHAGSAGLSTITHQIGTVPSASYADSYRLYADNVSGDGTASPHFLTEAGNTIKLYQQDANLLSLDNTGLTNFSGSVGVGTATLNSRFQVQGAGTTSSTSSLLIEDASGTDHFEVKDDGTIFSYNLSSGTGGAGYDAVCIDDTTNEITINTGGDDCVTSSARFKDDITSLNQTDSLDIIHDLNPVSFTYKNNQEPRIGLIAEEVNEVDDRLVFYEKDGTTPRGVRYQDITAHLLGAVQEIDVELQSIQSLDADNENSFLSRLLEAFKDLVVQFRGITTDEVQTERLCVGDTCVTEAELKELLKERTQENTQPQTSTNTEDTHQEDSSVSDEPSTGESTDTETTSESQTLKTSSAEASTEPATTETEEESGGGGEQTKETASSETEEQPETADQDTDTASNEDTSPTEEENDPTKEQTTTSTEEASGEA